MNKHIFIAACVLFSTTASSQLTPEQRIPDSVIGWWSGDNPDKYLKKTTGPDWTARKKVVDSLYSWIKKSYTPVGGLGTATKQINSSWYGLTLRVWNVSHDKQWTDAKGNFRPIPEENTPFGLQANTLPAVTEFAFLNGRGDYFFSWEPDGFAATDRLREQRKQQDPRIHPGLHRFITRITNQQNCIILAPGNVPPFIPVSIGEFLDKVLAVFESEKQQEMKRVDEENRGTDERTIKYRQSQYVYKEEQYKKARLRILKWKEKYKDRLNEPATFNGDHLRLQLAFNSDDLDPFAVSAFEKQEKQYQLVYKVPAALMEKCKTGQPQWITAWYPFETKESGNQLYEMYRAMTENLNYEYLYNYFFNPAANNGKPYTPARAEELYTRLNAYRDKSKAAANAKLSTEKWEPGVFFRDDFSSSTAGKDPVNWFFSRFDEHCSVTALPGEKGNWMQLGYNNRTWPSLLPRPFPKNFSLDYDLITDPFSERYGGSLSLYLSTWESVADGREKKTGNGASIQLDMNAGNEADFTNNNYGGRVKLEFRQVPEINKDSYGNGVSAEKELREFTNQRNKIHVSLRVKNNQVSLYLDNKPYLLPANMKLPLGSDCSQCRLPDLQFRYIWWRCTTGNAEKIKVYISNVELKDLDK